MKNTHKISLFFFLISLSITGQKSNVFHNRNFWKANPSIKHIDQKATEGNDITALNSNAFDAVVYAILEKTDTKTIKHLLSKKGNDVNKRTHDARTYIFWAAYSKNLELMKYLVSKGAKTDLIDSHGNTVLNFTAATGQLNKKIYEYLFKMDANINTEKNHNGANALLLIAPYAKDYSLLKYLISNGASLHDKDNNGDGIFEYAAKGGHISLLKKLLEKKVLIGNNAIIFASQGLRKKKNALETFKILENLGIKTNVINNRGKNPLHAIAYSSEDNAIYTYFINKGVDINLQDTDGDTPFMNAANSNTLEVVKFLSKNVKEINLKNKKGLSALAMAVNRNAVDVIKFLLNKGADIHTKDKEGNTLSYYLINNFRAHKTASFENKLLLLEEKGLTVNQLQNAGNTLLHIATQRNNLGLLKRLSSFKIDVNAINKKDLSALQIAVMKAKDDKIIKYLIGIGADKNIKTAFDESLFDLASENELLRKYNINFLK